MTSKMMAPLYFIALCILLSRSFEASIITLNDTNFNESLTSGLWLVKFYAPWCKHCKSLDPLFVELAEKTSINIGSLDATKNKKVAEEFGISRYPTIMYKKDGYFGKYDGARTLDGFMSFVARAVRPAIKALQDINTDAMQEDAMQELYEHNDNVAFLLTLSNRFISENQDIRHKKIVESFEKVASELQFHAAFALRLVEGYIEGHKDKALVISKQEKNRMPIILDKSAPSTEVIEQFVNNHNYPLISTFDNHNFLRLSHLGLPMLVAVLDYRNTELMSTVQSSLERLVSSQTYPIICGLLDANQYGSFIRKFHSMAPSILLINFQEEGDIPHFQSFVLSTVLPSELDAYLLSNILTPILDDTLVLEPPETGFLKDLWYKVKVLYPWSLLLFLPLVLVVLSYMSKYPDEIKIKGD